MNDANPPLDEDEYYECIYDQSIDYDDDSDDAEEMMDNCGQDETGFCWFLGTEYCDWVCPFGRLDDDES